MEGNLQTEEMDMLQLQGQANIWQLITGHVDAMAVRSAAELGIADIINSHGAPISLSKIAADIASPSLNISGLKCLMRFLVHKKVFDEIIPADQLGDDGEPLYGLNHSSKWLLHDAEFTLAPEVWDATDRITMAPWPFLGRSIKEGGSGTAFKMGNGLEMWELASANPDYNRAFNAGMACTAKITTDAILRCYKGGFEGIGTLVDVGGGSGAALGEIVKAYPHIKGINFDLPHVAAAAVVNNRVTNVGGDMFEAIPPADAVLMKWIMHDWSDEDCVRILKNCRKAIPEKTGKVVIVDMILQVGDDNIGPFDDICHRFDLIMFAEFSGGKERMEIEWKKILQEGGFPRYKIIRIPAMQSIIEAYPE